MNEHPYFTPAGPGRAQQEGHLRNKILHAAAAESRDGDGGGDDPEDLGAELGGVEASASRRELSQLGTERFSIPLLH